MVRRDITLKDWLDITFEGEQYIVSVIGLLRAYKEATKDINHERPRNAPSEGSQLLDGS